MKITEFAIRRIRHIGQLSSRELTIFNALTSQCEHTLPIGVQTCPPGRRRGPCGLIPDKRPRAALCVRPLADVVAIDFCSQGKSSPSRPVDGQRNACCKARLLKLPVSRSKRRRSTDCRRPFLIMRARKIGIFRVFAVCPARRTPLGRTQLRKGCSLFLTRRQREWRRSGPAHRESVGYARRQCAASLVVAGFEKRIMDIVGVPCRAVLQRATSRRCSHGQLWQKVGGRIRLSRFGKGGPEMLYPSRRSSSCFPPDKSGSANGRSALAIAGRLRTQQKWPRPDCENRP